MTDGIEHDLLSFVAANELVTAEQSAALLEIPVSSATDALEQLRARRLVSRIEMSSRLPAAYRITPDGAAPIDAALPPLRALSWSRYRHEIAVSWLWASARHGNLGKLSGFLSRRQMQAADATLHTGSLLDAPGATFSDQAAGPSTDPRLAYPDLALTQADGGWVALNVVLTAPEPDRMQTVIARLNREPLMRGQLYLVEPDGKIAEAINTAAQELGVSDKVHTQLLAKDGIAGA